MLTTKIARPNTGTEAWRGTRLSVTVELSYYKRRDAAYYHCYLN